MALPSPSMSKVRLCLLPAVLLIVLHSAHPPPHPHPLCHGDTRARRHSQRAPQCPCPPAPCPLSHSSQAQVCLSLHPFSSLSPQIHRCLPKGRDKRPLGVVSLRHQHRTCCLFHSHSQLTRPAAYPGLETFCPRAPRRPRECPPRKDYQAGQIRSRRPPPRRSSPSAGYRAPRRLPPHSCPVPQRTRLYSP